MNACIVAYTFYELDFRVRRYAEALTTNGGRVDVIALRGKGESSFATLNGVNIHRIQERSHSEKSLRNYMLNYVRFMIVGSWKILGLHLKCRYKILHIHNVPDFLIFMGAIPKWTGAKLILDIHDVIPEFYCQKFNKTMDSGLAKFLLFLENRSVRFADYVIVANDIWKDKIILRNNLKNNCSALLNYPSLQFYRPTEKTETNDGSAFNLIYPGTLSFQHGIDILVRAMAIVRNSGEKIHLHIYTLPTSMDFRKEMDRLIDELNVRNVIFFHDSVPPDLLGDIIGKSDAGVVPKRGGIFAGEAFSTKIFDFMAAGIPVVASKTKIDTYYFDESIVKFFHPEDHEDLAKAILELRRDPVRRKAMAKNGIKYIEENNWENKKQIYLDIVDGLLGNLKGMSKA